MTILDIKFELDELGYKCKNQFQGWCVSICFGGWKLKVGTLELGAWAWTCLHIYNVYFGLSWGNFHT